MSLRPFATNDWPILKRRKIFDKDIIFDKARPPGRRSNTSWDNVFFFSFELFNRRIIALQNFVVFCHTSTRISRRYPYVLSLPNLPLITLLISPLFFSIKTGNSGVNFVSLTEPDWDGFTKVKVIYPLNFFLFCITEKPQL